MSARNGPCPCGSGEKYKRCRMREDHAGPAIALLEKPPPTADEIAFAAGPTCGGCAHWRQRPPPKVGVNEASPEWQALPAAERRQIRERVRLQNQAAAVGGERVGECRRELLTIGETVSTPQGQGVQSNSYYPGPIPASWPCCGHYKPREAAP